MATTADAGADSLEPLEEQPKNLIALSKRYAHVIIDSQLSKPRLFV